MTRRARIITRLVTLVAGALAFAGAPGTAAAAGCTTTWKDPVSGDFNDASKWTAGVPLFALSSVQGCITVPGTYTVTVDLGTNQVTTGGITLGGSAGSQTLEVHSSSATTSGLLRVKQGGLLINPAGTVVLDCGTDAAPCNAGTKGPVVFTNGGPNNGSIIFNPRGSPAGYLGLTANNGTIQASGNTTISGQFGGMGNPTFSNAGSVTLAQGTNLSIANTDVSNTGTFTIPDGSTLAQTGTTQFTNDTGGQINTSGSGVMTTQGSFTEGAGTTSGAPVHLTGTNQTLTFTGSGASAFVIDPGLTANLSGDISAGQSVDVHAVGGGGNTTVVASGGFTNGGQLTVDCDATTMPCSSVVETLATPNGPLANTGTLTLAGADGSLHLEGALTNTGTVHVAGAVAYRKGGSATPVTFTNQGTFTLDNGALLTTDQTIVNGGGGTVNATGTGAVTITGNGTTNGTFTQASSMPAGNVLFTGSAGTLNLSGTGAGSFTVKNGANVSLTGNIGASQSLAIHAADTDSGPTTVTSASGLTNAGTLVLDCQTAAMPCSSGIAQLKVTGGTLANTGSLTTAAHGSVAKLLADVVNSGTVNLGDTTLDAGPTNALSQTAGTTTLGSGAVVNILPATAPITIGGGTLNGAGTINGSLVNTGGTVAPGNGSGPGTITVSGSYTQSAGGTVGIAVNGTTAGQFSALAVGGASTLDGTLALQPSAAYAAAAATGDNVAFLTDTARTGTFATTTVNPQLAGGRPFTASYDDANNRVLAVVGSPAPPVNSGPPTISGSTVQGQTLTASPGSWSGNPTYAYQWQVCDSTGANCTNVAANGNASTYIPTAADLGHTIKVVVTATNVGGSMTASSTATATITAPASGGGNGGGGNGGNGGGGNGGNGGGGSGGTTSHPAPVLSHARLGRSKFKATKGTTLSLSLSEKATVYVTVTQTVYGHKVHGHCSSKAKKGKPCMKTVVKLTAALPAGAGDDRLTFKPSQLAPGTYSMSIIAFDSAGKHSRTSTLIFTIKKGR